MRCDDPTSDSNTGNRLAYQAAHELPSGVFHDAGLDAVGWRDLVGVTRFETLTEPLLPAAWLVVSLLAAERGHYVIALALSFMFFLTGLRLIHNAFHSALGCRAGRPMSCYGS